MRGFILMITVFIYSNLISQEKPPTHYVDPLLGTSSSRWMLFPGPSMPFGMVKLSPDNTDEWDMDAGYEYSIESISGFNFVHSWMMGGLLTMPTTGEIKIEPGLKENPDSGYRSRFSHDNETASTGYYSVYLDDYGIKAELTSTTRTGFQRYTYPKTDQAHIVIDLNIPEEGRPTIVGGLVKKVSETEVEGFISREMNWNEYTLHFVIRFSQPFSSLTGWKGKEIEKDIVKISTRENIDIGAVANFSTLQDQIILVKTGISYVSIDQARLNLDSELDNFGWNFDSTRDNAEDIWNNLLSRIKVEGGSEIDKVKFYTNMYRAYCGRTIFSDVNGKYVDMCEKIQQLKDPNSPVFGCDAFWNTFWNLNQLWSLVTPDITNQWVNSQLEIYDRGGWLSKGPGGIEYSSIMVASHEIPLIVGAFQKGIKNFDKDKAYRAIKEIQTIQGQPHECGGYVGNRNLKQYMEMGFVPEEIGSVSNTLEYAYDDWSAAQMAKALVKMDDYNYFMTRSQYYKNVFDPSTGYIRPKHAGGPWLQEFQPIVKAVGKEDNFGGKDYVEGNAWQYSFFAPHDVNGLINLIGKEKFNERLSEGFELSKPNYVSQFVNHSNQPNMQAAWLFNYSGKPWLTQEWVRAILDDYYGTGPVDGYPGDEDQGQMGAWYVMSAMGLFEMDGGASTSPIYEISSPVFEKTTIMLDSNYYTGNKFTITAKNSSKENKYIQSAALNGKPINKFWFYHSELVKGGELVLDMGPLPNKLWAIDSPSPYEDDIESIVTTPYISSDSKLFLDSTIVTLSCDTDGAEIYYTVDGTHPSKNSLLYKTPIPISESTSINMRAYVNNKVSLPAVALLEKADLEEPIVTRDLEKGVAYKYYEGFFRGVNDFAEVDPKKSGLVAKFSIEPKDAEQYFAFDLEAYVDAPSDGLYTFYLISNDGSRLFLNDRAFINNDGLHPKLEVNKSTALKAGKHKIVIKYFQEGGTNHLELMWDGPGFIKQEVPSSRLYHVNY